MSDPLILAIDQGTTSSRAIVFDRAGKICAIRQKELTLYYPHNGWVEQDPRDIWADTLAMCRGVIADLGADEMRIAGIGITNQRETTILWDRKTGDAVYNAIVWQDRRAAEYCASLKSEGYEKIIAEKTGLLLDPYFSATKIAWVLDNVPGVRARAEAGDIAFGTVESFLLWHLTGGKVHASDSTNASRTMLYNIRTLQWDDELLRIFNIPPSILPEVHDNVADFGAVQSDILGRSITVGGMAGDQQAALFGQACFHPGMVKSTYGTGCFALMNIGSEFKRSQNRLLTTLGYCLGGQATYAIEGSIFVAGAAVQWLRDGLRLFADAAESEALATSVSDTGAVYFVPAFTGLGAPYWDPDARALICGMTRDTKAAHIIRAALEAQGFQSRDLMDAMAADTGQPLKTLRADGGLVNNGFVCQFLADILNAAIEVPHVIETTAFGAAAMAGLQAGIYNGLDDIEKTWRAERRYEPAMSPTQRETAYAGWQQAVRKVLA